jgi:RNA polymerase sigma-70 factor (ECF subfamily)
VNEIEEVCRAKEGDEAAWGALVRRHQEAVFRLAFLLLHDADDAEDVTQETFIRAYRGLERFDAARPLRPWLLEITRNLSYNWARTLRRRWATMQRWGRGLPNTGPLPEGDADPHHAVAQRITQEWQAANLWQAIRRLSASDQEVIYLRCFLDLPVEETAQALRVAPGTVKSRLSRGLQRLRRVVEQEFPALVEALVEEAIE